MVDTIKKVYKMFIDEEDENGGVFAISLVENPAIESNWIYLSKQFKRISNTSNSLKNGKQSMIIMVYKLNLVFYFLQ